MASEARTTSHAMAQFHPTVQSWPRDDEAADRFGLIAADLANTGKRIGRFDTMIAVHAVATGMVIVTNNVAHFSRVPGATVENWAASEQP